MTDIRCKKCLIMSFIHSIFCYRKCNKTVTVVTVGNSCVWNRKGLACYSYHSGLVAVLPKYVISSLPLPAPRKESVFHDPEGNKYFNRKIAVKSASDD